MSTALAVLRIKKRDESIVKHDPSRITVAAFKAMTEAGEGDHNGAIDVSKRVTDELYARLAANPARFEGSDHDFTVEKIQDLVEMMLMRAGFEKSAKAYILYRQKRTKVREKQGVLPARVRALADDSKKYFRNKYAEMIFYRSYARWIESEQRRETWVETVNRYMAFMRENLGDKLSFAEYNEVHEAILNMEVMPSMRLMWSAGDAARRSNVCAYNCSFIAPTSLEDFPEIVYLLMCGTGVGFSVEEPYVAQLPVIAKQKPGVIETYVVDDSKEGWADALYKGLVVWFGGGDVTFDYSGLREAGARLMTMGGKSSGPEPLKRLLEFTRKMILGKQRRRLSTRDVHDIICMIGEVVVAGGVRRSALISLTDLRDVLMRDAKVGRFYEDEPQRQMANNSAVYETKPTEYEFISEWLALMKSGTGERGIFNRGMLHKQLPERRLSYLELIEALDFMGVNPCGEINLQNKQFCNLTEAVMRENDTFETVARKVRVAAIIGTYQSTLTHFPYLSAKWKENCEAERLLGVSITGQWDNPKLAHDKAFQAFMKKLAVDTNVEFADRFGTNPSNAVTCVKPSGTVSQLVDAAEGMHARHSPYYIRRVRVNATDSMFRMLRDQGIPFNPEVGQTMEDATTFVFDFPIKAPKGAICKDDVSALQQLDHWLLVKENYTEHNPSVTVSVGKDEWIKVLAWVHAHWESVGGLSFLPRDEHVYQLAPYEAISKEKYEELSLAMENLDVSKILSYEQHDETQGARELACVSGVCAY